MRRLFESSAFLSWKSIWRTWSDHLTLPSCTVGNQINYWWGTQVHWNTTSLWPTESFSSSSECHSQQDAAQLLWALPLRAQDSSSCNNCTAPLTQCLVLKLFKGNVTSTSDILCLTRSWGNMMVGYGKHHQYKSYQSCTKGKKFTFFGGNKQKKIPQDSGRK